MTFAGNEIFLHAASATLSPNTYSKQNPQTHAVEWARASNAIDEDNREGSSGGTFDEFMKCAIAAADPVARQSGKKPMQYLKIEMTREEDISYVKLHLRDGLNRRRQQNGLTVSVSNSDNIDSATRCSDKVYNAYTHGQSPVFVCMNQARYIWVVLPNSPWDLQVCEVRAYTGT